MKSIVRQGKHLASNTQSSKLVEMNKLLKDLLIVQLGLAGVPQQNIRAIVGGDIKRVNRIVRLISSRRSERNR